MDIKDNYKRIMEKIEKACARVNRDPSQIRLMGVCKNQPIERLKNAYKCGVRILGENKVQEAEIHQAQLKASDIEWHFIGKLQKNKINKIIKNFNFIQSVDGVKSLEHIHKRVGVETDLFIEINVGEERNKSGFTVEGLKKALDYISNLTRVKITGLMAVPPFFDDAEAIRPYFVKLRELKDEINSLSLPNFELKDLSMGMSDDFEVAIEEGSTMLRIGTALFGRRLR